MVVATIQRRASQDGLYVNPEEDSPFFVPNYLLSSYPSLSFYNGDEIQEEIFEFLLNLSRIHLCIKKSIDLLALREHSSFELTTKLKQRNFSSKEIEPAINYLKSKNYLNDLRFTEIFITSRLRKKAEGKMMILKRLGVKGISSSMGDKVYSSLLDQEDESENCVRAFEKAERKYCDNKQKIINYLLQLGFSYSIIKEVLNKKS